MKYFSFSFLTFLFLSSCQNDSKSDGTSGSESLDVSPTTETTLEHLKKNALPEDDYYARVENSLVTLQDEFRKAEGKVPGVGKVTVYVDKDYRLLLKNEIDGDVIESRVSLRHLNPNNGGMSLVPDLKPGEYPGVKLHVLSGREGVEITKNGVVESEDERELTIFLPDRKSVERITPAIAQALNIVHKKVK